MNHSSTKTITVLGKASQKVVKTIQIPNNTPEDISLMDFLIENGITIASSCGGVGTCHKCLVNDSLISCQISLKTFIKNSSQPTIVISYL